MPQNVVGLQQTCCYYNTLLHHPCNFFYIIPNTPTPFNPYWSAFIHHTFSHFLWYSTEFLSMESYMIICGGLMKQHVLKVIILVISNKSLLTVLISFRNQHQLIEVTLQFSCFSLFWTLMQIKYGNKDIFLIVSICWKKWKIYFL